MFKKIMHGSREVGNEFLKRMHCSWNKMTRGAAEISRIITSAHGNQWRRQDKHQKNHDNHAHKCHKYK